MRTGFGGLKKPAAFAITRLVIHVPESAARSSLGLAQVVNKAGIEFLPAHGVAGACDAHAQRLAAGESLALGLSLVAGLVQLDGTA